MDPVLLTQALRGAVALRDKVVVVRLPLEALEPAPHLDAVATGLALLRALEVRVLVVAGASRDGDPDGETTMEQARTSAAAHRLVSALGRQGQRGLLLPTAGVISIHTLLIPAPQVPSSDASGAPSGPPPATPMYLPTVDQVLLSQLSALRYVPILLLPALDESGQASSMPAEKLCATLGKFLDAALVVLLRGADGDSAAAATEPGGRRTLVVPVGALDTWLEEILRSATPAAAPAERAIPSPIPVEPKP